MRASALGASRVCAAAAPPTGGGSSVPSRPDPSTPRAGSSSLPPDGPAPPPSHAPAPARRNETARATTDLPAPGAVAAFSLPRATRRGELHEPYQADPDHGRPPGGPRRDRRGRQAL